MNQLERDEFAQDLLEEARQDEANEIEDTKRHHKMQTDILFAFEELGGTDIVNEFNALLYDMIKLGHELSPKELMELL